MPMTSLRSEFEFDMNNLRTHFFSKYFKFNIKAIITAPILTHATIDPLPIFFSHIAIDYNDMCYIYTVAMAAVEHINVPAKVGPLLYTISLQSILAYIHTNISVLLKC